MKGLSETLQLIVNVGVGLTECSFQFWNYYEALYSASLQIFLHYIKSTSFVMSQVMHLTSVSTTVLHLLCSLSSRVTFHDLFTSFYLLWCGVAKFWQAYNLLRQCISFPVVHFDAKRNRSKTCNNTRSDVCQNCVQFCFIYEYLHKSLTRDTKCKFNNHTQQLHVMIEVLDKSWNLSKICFLVLFELNIVSQPLIWSSGKRAQYTTDALLSSVVTTAH